MSHKIKIIGIGILTVFTLIMFTVLFRFNDTEYIVIITDKERINSGIGTTSKSKYLVWGEDESGEIFVFENTDCLIRWKWNSSDIQGQLKEGRTYQVTVIGKRIPFLSKYQNIIDIIETE